MFFLACLFQVAGEDFVKWPSSEPRMAPNRSKLPMKRGLESQRGRGISSDARPRQVVQNLSSPEKRSNNGNDKWQVTSRQQEKGKGKAAARSPPLKKRRARMAQEEVEESDPEDEVEYEGSSDDSDDPSKSKFVLSFCPFVSNFSFS